MNKTVVKNFAVWARNKLITDIEYKAGLMGITENGIASALPQSTSEVQFFDIGTKDYASVGGDEIRQRNALVSAIRAKEREVGYAAAFLFIVEKVAYTWFNRLIAIRFMEVNDYLPSRVRVLSSENENKIEPDMVTKPFDTDMIFSSGEQDYILQLKDENRLDELFRWLFIRQCWKLHEVLPVLFDSKSAGDRQNEYLELLLTISFTDKDGILWHLVHDIPERDFRILTEEDLERQKIENIPDDEMPAGQVEIIGWLYQYYNTEPKDQVFADLKKNIKIGKDKIPAATQLFTPDWIVRYMVENSLGRLWVEGYPNEELKKNWKYYLEEAEQELEVEAQLAEIRKGYAALHPEEIRVIDPCMGSGHILVYLFEVLMQIYESQGWTRREAAQSIVQNNLYGLDIDERASQLAYFAVMMKARQYDRRFLERGIEPHVYEIRESNGIDNELLDYFSGEGSAEAYYSGRETPKLFNDITTLMNELRDAKEYGSILNVTQVDFPALYARFDEIRDDISIYTMPALNDLLPLVKQAEAMAQKYDIVVTNPPYMGASNMSGKMFEYTSDHFISGKTDLYANFMEHCTVMLRPDGRLSMITQQGWMFQSTFEKLRDYVLNKQIYNLIQLGARAFDEISGEVVQTCAFVMGLKHVHSYCSCFSMLVDYDGEKEKEKHFFDKTCRYYKKLDYIRQIPTMPVAYWVSSHVVDTFANNPPLSTLLTPRQGVKTLDNNRFLRLWMEIEWNKIGFHAKTLREANAMEVKWFPYNKGGEARKWYGNNTYVVNWENDGREMKDLAIAKYKCETRTITNISYFFLPGITWSDISTGNIAVRRSEAGFIFDSTGIMAFGKADDLQYIIALMNSKVMMCYLKILAPTLHFNGGAINNVPLRVDTFQRQAISGLVDLAVQTSRAEWDSYETSWDFVRHPLIGAEKTIAKMFDKWAKQSEERATILKETEEELNRTFISIYGLQDELQPNIEATDVTVRQANINRDIRSLVSYAVGCMFGRYSLDTNGIAYAGGIWDSTKYTSFIPDTDNCIPITDEPYFEDDIVGRFVEFIRVVYGTDTLEENLSFIAKALGNKGNSSREVIRNYFLNDFFRDHCSTYSVTGSGKRPIYWLFDSGKQNGFKALVYMHRWNADTIGNVRVEYLHKMQRVYEKEINRMQEVIENSRNNREISQATKRREKLVRQLKETRDFDAKISHAALSRMDIDLDDGVKVNYEKVQKGPDGKSLGILAKI